MYRPDDELKRLPPLAVELGVGRPVHRGLPTPARCWPRSPSAATAASAGSARSSAARDPWFNVSVGDGFYHYHRCWADDLTVPFAALPRLHRAGRAPARTVDRPDRALRAEERDRLVADYRELLGTDEEKARLRPDARPVPAWSSPTSRATSSTASTGSPTCSSTRSASSARCWPSPGCLRRGRGRVPPAPHRARARDRRRHAGLGRGRPALGARHWPAIVAERKRIDRGLAQAGRRRPRWAPVPEVIDDPAVYMLWGITRETIEAWLDGQATTRRRSGASPPRRAWSRAPRGC